MSNSDNRLIVALDQPTIEDAWAIVEALGDTVSFYKIGLQLIPIGGMDLSTRLKAAGKQVFLDYKLHDIPATVEKATRSRDKWFTVLCRKNDLAIARIGLAVSKKLCRIDFSV